MKKLILLIVIAFFSASIYSQKIEANSLDTLSVKYITLLCVEKALGNDVRVVVDYGGDKVAAIAENGKLVVFNSSIHALNFVCEHGYKFVFFAPGPTATAGYKFMLENLNIK